MYHTPVMTHVAGSDRLGPRVEEVWVWKLMIGSGWFQLISCNYWINMMIISLYMFCSIKDDHEVVGKHQPLQQVMKTF